MTFIRKMILFFFEIGLGLPTFKDWQPFTSVFEQHKIISFPTFNA